MHLCRGNFRSSWIAQGGYEPVAEILFNQIGVNGYFMEFDTERAGGFEPLRFVPEGKTVVLGIVTSKTGELESVDDLKRRIDEPRSIVDLDQLCLSPQCGFASTEEATPYRRRAVGEARAHRRGRAKSVGRVRVTTRSRRRAHRSQPVDDLPKALRFWPRWPWSSMASTFRSSASLFPRSSASGMSRLAPHSAPCSPSASPAWLLGSPFAGYCGDRFGRRITSLIGCVVLWGPATIATAFLA